jgi:hypothetical protein
MTNFEYYKDEILEIVNNDESLAVYKNSSKPVKCGSITCKECISSNIDDCEKGIYNWLYAEHIEKPKLTKKERQFCELIETGWIARDNNGSLYRYSKAPCKRSGGTWTGFSGNSLCVDNRFPGCTFSFITWDDAEPWSVEDLLKLEVE